ncbi:putative zinc-binding metallopeptidase [Roseibium sp. MMSF_3361]|uniref:zinc-binding metallopeptidase family protein n=2 Tax=unclassified Roseibium TaxID=2629323 RepID=UPI00273D581C|nr:putative zinc-binding metallopeptidase [Roseibium sp. MMSF_3361]
MKIFECPECSSPVYFENMRCSCASELFYNPETAGFSSQGIACANRELLSCNWAARPGEALCDSCVMTKVHPEPDVVQNLALWARTEASKRWVLANLKQLGWFAAADTGPRPSFELLSETTSTGADSPVMGHLAGKIIINVAEADPATLVDRREKMQEPFRTMVGHFRHEISHFLFSRLSGSHPFLTRFRSLFGDETADYGDALQRYYETGAGEGWSDTHISEYASAHPHEDWAETAAHVLHLLDLRDSANAVGMTLPGTRFGAHDTRTALNEGLDLGVALNHMNRSMGLDDAYPFVIAPIVRDKLEFCAEQLNQKNRTGKLQPG